MGPNHLKKKRAEAMAIYKAENPEEEEEEDEEVVAATLARRKTIADAALSKKHTLPVQRPEIMRRITLDIAMDRAQSKAALSEEKDEDDEAMDALAATKSPKVDPTSVAKKRATLRRIATNTAIKRFQTSLNRGSVPTPFADDEEQEPDYATKSDAKALEALKHGDPNDTKKAVALTARAKLATRRATKMKRRRTSVIRAESLDAAMRFEIKKDPRAHAYGGYR